MILNINYNIQNHVQCSGVDDLTVCAGSCGAGLDSWLFIYNLANELSNLVLVWWFRVVNSVILVHIIEGIRGSVQLISQFY